MTTTGMVSEVKPDFEDRVETTDLKQDANAAAAEEQRLGVWATIRQNPKVVFWCFFFAFSGIGWGFDAQVNGAVLSIPQFRITFGSEYHGQAVVPASWLSAFQSISSVGQFLGGFVCSSLADRIGRRWSLFIGLLFCCGGIFGEVFSVTKPAFLVGKLILGVGLGFYLTVAPLYASELAPIALRGIVTAGVNFAIVIGQLLSNAVIKGFGSRTDLWAYRGPFAIQWLFVIILLVGLPFAPESPWYHVRKGDVEKASKALRQLYPASSDINPRLAMIIRTVEEEIETTRAAKWIHCFRSTDLVRTCISIGVFACQQLSGIVFVLGFSTYFFELAGIDTSDAFDLGVGVTACGVVGCIISWSVINSWGRRKLFITGMSAITVVLLLMGILDFVRTDAARWVQASCTVVYALLYQLSIGPLAFAILGETSSTTLRAKTVGLATACQAVFGTIMNVVVPYMVNPDAGNLKGKVGFIFGGACLLSTIWCYFYIPELKGYTFEQIDYLFKHRVTVRKMGEYDWEQERA